MNSTWILFSLLPKTLILSVLLGISLPHVNTNNVPDYTTLVYKHCTTQQSLSGSTDRNESHSQALLSLFQALLPQSSNSRYYKTTAGVENYFVSGLFQCRGDLTAVACYDCVNNLPQVSKNFCNTAVAGRIQLNGCYFHYEIDEFTEDGLNEHGLLHKICGQKGAEIGFEEVRDEAFAVMENGVIDGHGFYSGEYGSVHVLAQCEGGLGGCDCGECVRRAALIAQEECIGSISGQIYMDRCYVSYSYYGYGIPSKKYHGKYCNSTNLIHILCSDYNSETIELVW